MRAILVGAVLAAAALGLPDVARASSLPAADIGERTKLGVGLGAGFGWRPGGSLAVDFPFADGIAVGASLASTFAGGVTVDVRGVYRFVDMSPESPAIAGILGLWGAAGGLGPDPRFGLGVPLAPSIGFGLAYSPLDKLTLRLNLAYSPFFNYGTETLGFIGGPPSTGIEAAYALSPGFEVTAGLNGNGDILGVSYLF